MAQNFTHYWSGVTVRGNEEGELLTHDAGNEFMSRGAKVGDNIYVVNISRGELYLIGRLTIGEFVFSDVEATARLGYEPWSAKW